ncbi:MAG: prepilin-type N-terminal cleavage/methylation domain-containing protein [Candidatus Marinamargulisbacteria bacterium]|jgi:prepilin-type N-terminal cleavage/methylation domain-containing protein
MFSFRSEKGFTMIELVVVLVLIGLIAAIAIPKYLDVTTNAKEKSLRGAISSVRGAIQMSYSKSVLDGTPAYPSLNGTIFTEGSVPNDVYTPTNSVTLTAEDPITTFPADGGWIYNETTGEVRVDYTGYTTW